MKDLNNKRGANIMWNTPSKQRLNEVPKLYETEEVPLKEKLIYLHFFLRGCDWFIAETDGKDLMWGFCILNNDLEMAEWGFVSLAELNDIKVGGWLKIECSQYWEIKPAKQVEKICISQGWKFSKPATSIEIECPVCKRVIVSDSDSKEIQCSECKIIILQRHIDSTKSDHQREHIT